MRWSLNSKLFCLFLPLTLVSLCFGFIVFQSLSYIKFNNTHILHLKDFQIQLKSLEAWQARLFSYQSEVITADFLTEVNKAQKMALDISSHHNNLPEKLQERLMTFPALSENFSKAYLTLYGHYQENSQLLRKTTPLFEQLKAYGLKDSQEESELSKKHQLYHRIVDLIDELRGMEIQIHHQRNIDNLENSRRVIGSLLEKIDEPNVDHLAHQIIELLEGDHFNNLAILDREQFLKESADYFFSVVDETIASMADRFAARNSKSRITILVIIGLAITLNLVFWIISSRYFRKFIHVQKKSIHAIEQGSYDFIPDRVSNDEIGDLSSAMVTMAEKLKQSQSQLRGSELKYRTLVENLEDAIWEIDAQGRITFISEAVHIMLDYRPVELIGTAVVDLVHPGDTSTTKSLLQQYFNKQQSFDMTILFQHKNSSIVNMEIGAQPVFSAGGFSGYRGTMRDATEKKQLEQQLQQSQKMESVGRLAGGVAHDFNNMLSVIIGYSEMALEEVAREQKLYSDLQQILNAANRSMDMTRQLLAFARKQTIAPVNLDINETISGMLKMLQRLIGENIGLAWQPGTNIWRVKMDPSQLDQIMANLCVNARDAISGVGRITIGTENITLDKQYATDDLDLLAGEYIQLTVSDDGSGIDTYIVEKIFEPFFSTKGDMGTGLGLATVYGIIKQNNGSISVSSKPDLGTTFKIYIPRYSALVEEVPAGESEEIPRGHNETILLIEDEQAITDMVDKMLKKLGYYVLTANTPTEALALASNSTAGIHLVITDVIMPEMNGKELVEKIRSLDMDFKTLYMSGYTADVIASEGVLNDGVNFIEKPFSTRDLAVKVRALLDP